MRVADWTGGDIVALAYHSHGSRESYRERGSTGDGKKTEEIKCHFCFFMMNYLETSAVEPFGDSLIFLV